MASPFTNAKTAEPKVAPPAIDEAGLIAHARAAAEAVCAWFDTRYASDPRFVFDEKRAELACGFFPRFLRHTIGPLAGQPFHLEPWQRAIVRTVFGWKWVATGFRVIRSIYLFVARKNGKSTFAAGLALLLLIADGVSGAQVFSAAADREQASVIFNEAARMVATSDPLSAATETYKTAIICPQLMATYRVLSAEAETKHGLNPYAVVFDELHTQRTRDLYDVMHTAVGAQTESLEVYITTAGADRESICYEVHKYALGVRAGKIDDVTFLPVLFFAPDDADWTDPRTLAYANPSLGVAVQVAYLLREQQKAMESPSYENTFRRLHLNQWVGQATRWLPMERWPLGAPPSFDEALLKGRVCFAGLDLSSTQDITAFVLVFPPVKGESDPKWYVICRFWVPGENLKRKGERDAADYVAWEKRKLIFSTEGNVVDYDAVRAGINLDRKLFRIKEIAYDRWNSSQIVNDLVADGAPMVPFGQGFGSMSPAAKEFERLFVAGLIAHNDNPALRWMAENVAIKEDDAGNIKPSKSRSGGRIDGIVAAVMAVGRASVNDNKPGMSERIKARGGLIAA